MLEHIKISQLLISRHSGQLQDILAMGAQGVLTIRLFANQSFVRVQTNSSMTRRETNLDQLNSR